MDLRVRGVVRFFLKRFPSNGPARSALNRTRRARRRRIDVLLCRARDDGVDAVPQVRGGVVQRGRDRGTHRALHRTFQITRGFGDALVDARRRPRVSVSFSNAAEARATTRAKTSSSAESSQSERFGTSDEEMPRSSYGASYGEASVTTARQCSRAYAQRGGADRHERRVGFFAD